MTKLNFDNDGVILLPLPSSTPYYTPFPLQVLSNFLIYEFKYLINSEGFFVEYNEVGYGEPWLVAVCERLAVVFPPFQPMYMCL